MVMAEKRDWLGDCNDRGVPLEDFRLQFCVRCLQPECTRSQHGRSRFDARVADWENKLFLNVSRMDEADPRFASLSAKKFLSIDSGPAPEVRSWVDPRDLTEAPAAPAPAPEPPREYEVPATTQLQTRAIADLEEQGPAEVVIQEEVTIQESPPRMAVQAMPMNTSNQHGQMVGDEKVDKQPAQPVSDPWEPKKPAPSDDLQVVAPGAKIRLGGSGV